MKPLPPTLIHPLTHTLRAKEAGGLHDNDGSCWGGGDPPALNAFTGSHPSFCVCVIFQSSKNMRKSNTKQKNIKVIHRMKTCSTGSFYAENWQFLTSCLSQSAICALGEKTYLERQVLLPVHGCRHTDAPPPSHLMGQTGTKQRCVW